MVTKLPCRGGCVKAIFTMPAALWADSIYVVGDFNDWNERATPLRQTESGWMVAVELEPGRAYQYRYLINGNEWHNDWQADGYEPNKFGGDNSVVITPAFELEPAAEPDRLLTFAPSRLRLVPTG